MRHKVLYGWRLPDTGKIWAEVAEFVVGIQTLKRCCFFFFFRLSPITMLTLYLIMICYEDHYFVVWFRKHFYVNYLIWFSQRQVLNYSILQLGKQTSGVQSSLFTMEPWYMAYGSTNSTFCCLKMLRHACWFILQIQKWQNAGWQILCVLYILDFSLFWECHCCTPLIFWSNIYMLAIVMPVFFWLLFDFFPHLKYIFVYAFPLQKLLGIFTGWSKR